jgi:hypothetical protein
MSGFVRKLITLWRWVAPRIKTDFAVNVISSGTWSHLEISVLDFINSAQLLAISSQASSTKPACPGIRSCSVCIMISMAYPEISIYVDTLCPVSGDL